MRELRTILYVEDDPDIQSVAQLALEAVGGFDVTLCASGESALRSAIERVPDLVLLDVMMPGMDGPTTLKAMRAPPALARVPVIFVTAKVQSSEIEQYKSLGALEVIGRLFDPMTPSSAILAIWAAHQDS